MSRVGLTFYEPCHDGIDTAIITKVCSVSYHWFCNTTFKIGITTNITNNKIYVAVLVNISRKNLSPKAICFRKPRSFRDIRKPNAVVIVKYFYWHPVATQNQVGPSIFINISPNSIRYHSCIKQVATTGFRSDIGKFYLPGYFIKIISQKNISPSQWIHSGNSSVAHKQINISIFVKIYGSHTTTAVIFLR